MFWENAAIVEPFLKDIKEIEIAVNFPETEVVSFQFNLNYCDELLTFPYNIKVWGADGLQEREIFLSKQSSNIQLSVNTEGKILT